MIILVEGSDRTGKDSLIDVIKSKYAFPAFYEIKSSKLNSVDTLAKWYHTYSVQYYLGLFQLLINIVRSQHTTNIVLNRGWISEYVYSKLYRNYDGNFVWTMEATAMKLIKSFGVKTFLIVLTDNPHALELRDDGKSVSRNGKRKVAEEQKLFVKALNKSSMEFKFNFYISGKTPEKVQEEVINYIDGRM